MIVSEVGFIAYSVKASPSEKESLITGTLGHWKYPLDDPPFNYLNPFEGYGFVKWASQRLL